MSAPGGAPPQQLPPASEPQEITDPAPDLAPDGTEWPIYNSLKEKAMAKVAHHSQQLAEHTHARWEQFAESDRGKEWIAYASQKHEDARALWERKQKELEESERYQKLKEKASDALGRTGEYKDKTKEKAKQLWSRGKGKIIKIKEKAGWGRSAQETLLQRQEAAERWKDMKIRGADDIVVAARSEYTTAYFVEKGTLMRWSFRVQDFDIGFGVRVRIMQDGGSREEDVLPVERFDNVDTIEGSWVADEDRTMVLVFDNSYSKLRSKTVAYLVGTEKASAQDMVDVEANTAADLAQDELMDEKEQAAALAAQGPPSPSHADGKSVEMPDAPAEDE